MQILTNKEALYILLYNLINTLFLNIINATLGCHFIPFQGIYEYYACLRKFDICKLACICMKQQYNKENEM